MEPMENKPQPPKKKINRDLIYFRPIEESDLEFLFRVYASTRSDEMALTGWSDVEKENFLRMQFELQHRQYMNNYQGGRFDIIYYDQAPVGRLYVHKREKEIRIVDIAILPQYCNQGLGSTILRDLMAAADEENKILSLHVVCNNPALAMYQHLGFEIKELLGVYYYLERQPGGSPQ